MTPDKNAPGAGILGCGYRLPSRIRRNDDPIFANLDRTHNPQGVYQSNLFRGLDRRHYLGPDESIEDLMAESCDQALEEAGVPAADVDRLYGYATVPQYVTPNPLYQLHHRLGLAEDALVIPINSEFTNFQLGLIHAADAVNAGHARHCLVTCGSNWTGHFDYTLGHATAGGDAAGGALVGRGDRFVILDHAGITLSRYYHAMTMGLRAVSINGRRHLPLSDSTGLPVPILEINQTGIEALASAIKEGVPVVVGKLLARHGIDPGRIALTTHQGIRILLDYWAERIQPKEYLETLADFGNMGTAAYPVNLAHFQHSITAEYLVMAGIGPGMHVTAVLLRV